MITIHRIWFGSNPIPETYQRYWNSWKRQYPEACFRTWTDQDIDNLPLTSQLLKSLESPVSKADIARYEILFTHGGLYIDCDMMPWEYMDLAELASQVTICNEDNSEEYCSIGLIAAPPKMAIFMDIINSILTKPIDEKRPNISTGPWLFGSHIKNHPHKRLPTKCVYPYAQNEPLSTVLSRDLSETIAIHTWGGSWLTVNHLHQKILQYINSGEIYEAEKLIESNPGLDTSWSENIKSILNSLRSIRNASFNIASILTKTHSVDTKLFPQFEFRKLAKWLIENNQDTVIWQIGAADGKLVDPLRPLLINYDPPAMLLEPNPYLFKALTQSYKNNSNTKLIELAYNSNNAQVTLNAINPSKVAQLGLPTWVNGISSTYDDRNAIGGKTIDEKTHALIKECVEKIPVSSITFAQLLALSPGNPTILVIDAEGMDKLIIEDILENNASPQLIHFEIQCLTDSDKKILLERLSLQYIISIQGNDLTAIAKNLFSIYSRNLYASHGISSVYATALKTVTGLVS
jgi:Glycosyltransferase sugar-binding region containing DXD motif